MSIIREVNIQGRTIRFEFQKYAKQANGTVMVSCGDTQVLVTACAAEKQAAGIDFFPLGVDYAEKTYAAGRVPGGYLKREGKPSDQSALNARLIDRPLRPLFPKGFRNETVITATVMSYEHGISPAPLALVGASTALMISDIPFNGPVAGLRLGLKDGEYIIDPEEGQENENELELMIACGPDAVLMVEAGAQELPESKMLEAIRFAHEAMRPYFDMQFEIQQAIGKEKWEIPTLAIDPELQAKTAAILSAPLKEAFGIREKKARGKAISAAIKGAIAELNPDNLSDRAVQLDAITSEMKSDSMRSMVLDDRRRIDGRGLEDIRPISCEVGPLKRPHGSSLFTRGETQALASLTLAASEDRQRSESLWDSDLKERFLLHYNFPPFSVGEARMQRPPSRREIGHGNLARRALLPVLPSQKHFNFTLRLVSETLESNGSSSMAAVCSGTMAMLHAGVPLKDSVAGIAMGLIKEGEKYAILSDILGDEDHLGDMDFKVCGTRNGITALQMDIKIGGLSAELMVEALEQAKRGRIHILNIMEKAIAEPSEVGENTPQVFKIKVGTDRIKDIIGPGGKVIKKITAETGAKIDVEDSGIISVMAPDLVSAQAAKTLIKTYLTPPQVGEVFLGKVVKVMDFGVFVELRAGLDGFCHVSQLDDKRIEDVQSVVKEGEEILVKIIDIDRQGRVKLSRREAFPEATK